jgi:hypothetical protein
MKSCEPKKIGTKQERKERENLREKKTWTKQGRKEEGNWRERNQGQNKDGKKGEMEDDKKIN